MILIECVCVYMLLFFCKQKTAYEMRISDWSSDVCSSDLLGLSLTLRGPFDYADSDDLAGGTSAEDSGPAQAAWQTARLAMLVSVSAMTSAIFLGGHHGPWLPGPLWMLLKLAAVLAILVAATHLLARLPPAPMLTLLWKIGRA